MPEKCDKCGTLGNDRRTLWMACLYAMDELGVPFDEIAIHGEPLQKLEGRGRWNERLFSEPMDDAERHRYKFFTLRVCKGCRGDWMEAIKRWFRSAPTEAAGWNRDESRDDLDTIAALTADAEKVSRDVAGLTQRAADLVETMRAAHDAAVARNR